MNLNILVLAFSLNTVNINTVIPTSTSWIETKTK